VLASLVNPYGWKLHLHILRYLGSSWIRDTVHEFAAPNFRGSEMLQFELLLGVGLLCAGAALRTRRVVEALWIIGWGHMALVSARHIPVFIAVCTPSIAIQLSAWLTSSLAAQRCALVRRLDAMATSWRAIARHTSLLPWFAMAALSVLDRPVRWPRDFPEPRFPTQLVHQYAPLLKRSRVFTTDQWADYLVYVDPEQKVFIDGRSDFYGETLGTRYLELLGGHWRFRKWLDHYALQVALLPLPNPLAELLKREPGWRLLVDDGRHALFEREAR
jgi:hypothetical protein